jgi:ATP-dependent DNA helicase RecG
MVSLSDRLDYIVGAKAADSLDEVFGIRTVDDLLRHYPRSYTEGATVRGADDERPEDGEHITVVDTIADAVTFPMKKDRKKICLRITVGSGRSKVTATFFNANYLRKDLTKNTRVMLSGEVGFFKGEIGRAHV